MGTQEVELECAGEKSAVDGSDPVVHLFIIFIIIIIFILDHESSGRVTHDSHKLQTKAINHATRHYMDRRELESNQPINVPSLCVSSLSASVPVHAVAIAGRCAPHLATTRKPDMRTPATAACCSYRHYT